MQECLEMLSRDSKSAWERGGLLTVDGGMFEINQMLFAYNKALVADSQEKFCKRVSDFGRLLLLLKKKRSAVQG